MRALIERVAGIERDDHVRITLSDDTVIEGRVNPMEYLPGDHFRFEVRPDGDSDARFEVVASHEDGEWTPVRANRIAGDETEWEPVGEVASVNVEYQEGQNGHDRYQSDVRL